MKIFTLVAAAIALGAAGCNSTPTSDQVAVPDATPPTDAAEVRTVKLTPEEELERYCRVCVVDKNERIPEFLPSRLDTKHSDKLYKHCSDDCKKSFDANPQRYVLK